MRGNEFLDKMDIVDPIYVEEADSNIAEVSPKRKTVLLVAAAMLVLLATGAAYIVSNLTVDVNNFGANDVSYVIEIPHVDLDEDFRKTLEESGYYTAEDIDVLEEHHSAFVNSDKRFIEIAQEYGLEYKDSVAYYYREKDEVYCETGAFYNQNQVFAFLHTNDETFKHHTRIYVFLYNEETGECKYERIVLVEPGAYAATISAQEDWSVEGALLWTANDYTIGGGSSTMRFGYGSRQRFDRDTYDKFVDEIQDDIQSLDTDGFAWRMD